MLGGTGAMLVRCNQKSMCANNNERMKKLAELLPTNMNCCSSSNLPAAMRGERNRGTFGNESLQSARRNRRGEAQAHIKLKPTLQLITWHLPMAKQVPKRLANAPCENHAATQFGRHRLRNALELGIGNTIQLEEKMSLNPMSATTQAHEPEIAIPIIHARQLALATAP